MRLQVKYKLLLKNSYINLKQFTITPPYYV